mmetsp:Transcript_48602/g.114050  ORF Transcript_48602/g.114050 Transcript_48602/m.114050 type:complete len:226 (-) Transcript_48602:648-1325(-)
MNSWSPGSDLRCFRSKQACQTSLHLRRLLAVPKTAQQKQVDGTGARSHWKSRRTPQPRRAAWHHWWPREVRCCPKRSRPVDAGRHWSGLIGPHGTGVRRRGRRQTSASSHGCSYWHPHFSQTARISERDRHRPHRSRLGSCPQSWRDGYLSSRPRMHWLPAFSNPRRVQPRHHTAFQSARVWHPRAQREPLPPCEHWRKPNQSSAGRGSMSRRRSEAEKEVLWTS